MSRLRWPDSTNSVSEKPGTIHKDVVVAQLTPSTFGVECDAEGSL